MSDYSLDLNEDQLTIQKWVHDFAEYVVRPVAEEWDEREEFPWPVVKEAAEHRPLRLGVHGQLARRPDRAHPPARHRGAVLGRRRHRPRRSSGSGLAAAGISGNGTPEQVMEWVPAVLRHRRRREARRLLRERARRRLRRVLPAHPGGLRRGHRRVGAQRHQGVDHQRRHRRRARRGGGGRARPEGPGPGQLRRAARHRRACRWVRSTRSTASGRRTPPRSSSTTCGSRAAACSAARTSSTRSWPGPVRRGHSGAPQQPAMATFEATRPAVGAQALGIARAAYEYSLDYAKERRRSAGRSS